MPHTVRPLRIAFVAMSGIRAADTHLLELGLTLPGFVERSKTIASLPSLGLLTLAGMTPAQHHRRYFEVVELADIDPLPQDYDLVAISSLSAQIPEAYQLADQFRATGAKVVMGGLHVTSLPDEALQHADAVVVGEGESVWLDIIKDAADGTLKGTYDARHHSFSLDDAPMPAYELLDLDRYNRITIQTSRGCPYKCSFCASSILLTSKYKQKPAEKVLAELDRIIELWDRPFIEFADDNTFVNKRFWKKLLPEIAKRNVRWFTETDIGVADDPELLDLMREAGCAQVLIGLESPMDEGLDGIEMRADFKKKRIDGYKEAVTTIQSHGIRVNGCFIVGLDGHTERVFDAIYDFAEETALFDVQVTLPTPFPGTPYYDELKAAGRLTHDLEWGRNTLFDLNFEPTPMSKDQLMSGFYDLVDRLYNASFTEQRRNAFKERFLRPIVRKKRGLPVLA